MQSPFQLIGSPCHLSRAGAELGLELVAGVVRGQGGEEAQARPPMAMQQVGREAGGDQPGPPCRSRRRRVGRGTAGLAVGLAGSTRRAAWVSGAGSRRSPAPPAPPPAPQGALAGPARRQPFPGSSPLLSSGPRAPRASPQGCARSRARALCCLPALSARARSPDDAGPTRSGLGSLRSLPPSAGPLRRRPRFPARRRSGPPNLRPQGGGGGGEETGPGGRRTWWS